MTTEDDFQWMLDANPSDHLTRLVFADWLEERGDPRAEGYRALGAGGFAPCSTYSVYMAWFGNELTRAGDERLERYLPPDWFELIELGGKSHKFAPDHHLRVDCLRREAEDTAALAFAKLPPERRAELLNPAPQGAAA